MAVSRKLSKKCVRELDLYHFDPIVRYMSAPACTHCNDTKRIAMFMPGSWADCDWCAVLDSAPEPEEDEETPDTITIDGEVCDFHRVLHTLGNGGVEISTDSGDYIVFESQEAAGKAARAYWADMASNSPTEFAEMVGKDTLVAWAMGQSAGPGSTQVSSLEEWLDLYLNVPEEHFAGYNGEECDVGALTGDTEDDIGFDPAVAYRTS